MASSNDNAKRDGNYLASHLPEMIEELSGLREVFLESAGYSEGRKKAEALDAAELIGQLLSNADARQLYDAIEVLTCGNFVGGIAIVELRSVLAGKRRPPACPCAVMAELLAEPTSDRLFSAANPSAAANRALVRAFSSCARSLSRARMLT